MKRHIPGLHREHRATDDALEGVFLVRVDRAFYRWHQHRPFYVLRLAVLEPREHQNHSLTGRLYCTPAEQHLRKAIEVAPLSIPGYINLANFYRLRQQPPEAEQVLKDGVEHNPDASPLYINRADLLYAQQKKEAAEATLGG